MRRELVTSAYDALGLPDEDFATRVETPARTITSASWWIDQRDADPDELEELVSDAASNAAAGSVESPY